MLLLLLLSFGCEAPQAQPVPSTPDAPALAVDETAPLIDLRAAGVTIEQAFPPPEGAVRVETDAFGDWLRQRPLKAAGEPVRTHDGRLTGHHARVVDMPLVKGDLQQCADSILRLRADWLRLTQQAVSFHATSGDPIPWSRWQGGERPYAPGNKVLWRPGTEGGWDAYLSAVFTWAGTASLEAYETKTVDSPRGGDLFVEGGFPGHAVLLLDVAQRGEETFLLVGEGYMPAQDFHVELGPESGWWPLEDGLSLPVWTFERAHLRRFK